MPLCPKDGMRVARGKYSTPLGPLPHASPPLPVGPPDPRLALIISQPEPESRPLGHSVVLTSALEGTVASSDFCRCPPYGVAGGRGPVSHPHCVHEPTHSGFQHGRWHSRIHPPPQVTEGTKRSNSKELRCWAERANGRCMCDIRVGESR